MDRFIEIEVVASTIKSRYLKSNMDRFIVILFFYKSYSTKCLKSNMDRFIDFKRKSKALTD